MAYLYFLSGPYSGKRAHLRAKRITVGRAEGNKLLIEDESVSPKHFTLCRSGDDYFVDIGETRAPLAVNGKQVLDAKLADGDTLQIGAVLAQFFTETARPADDPHPLDFWAEPGRSNEVEVFSLDDAEELPPLPPSGDRSRTGDSGVRAKTNSKSGEHSDRARSPDRARQQSDDSVRVRSPDRARTGSRRPPRRNRKKALVAFCFLVLMLGGSAFAFRKDIWKEPAKPVAQTENKVEEQPPIEGPIEPGPIEPPVPKIPVLAALPIGIGPSGLKAEGKIHRSRSFKSHQEAVDAAQPGDAVIFDSNDAKPIVVQKPLVDIQFLSGSATWELHADLIDCQFIYHESRQFIQRAGKLQRCVFFRCPIKHTDLVHADAVSFYFDERSPLHPKDNPDGGKSPTLLLTGFVRDVLIHRPQFGSPTSDRRFDMKWLPSIRIHATDPEGDGRGTYIMNPVVLGQRAWTPIQISRGKGITIAHITTDGNAWADPVFEILRGDDCVILCTSFGSETPTTVEAYTQLPTKLKYHDHEEFGYSNGPAYRGALGTIIGMRNRIVAHGDMRKPYTVNRKMTLPGLHYADGIVAVDPFIQQFATERGGLGINFAEHKGTFVMQPVAGGAEFLSSQQKDDAPMYPREGPLMHRPTFVPLKDLRINAGDFDKLPLFDMTGKPVAEIEKVLNTDKSVFLGPGTYEFKQTLRSGFIVGAGMEATILKWPADVDCAQRNCRGMINCTVSGGRNGYNSQAGTGNRLGNPNGLFLRTRFENQKEAGINVHTSQFQTWQDCEFIGQRVGFGNGLDKGAGIFKGDKGPSGGITIDNLNIVNCSFRKIRHRAIDLTPDSRQLGHVGVHNCSFEDTAETALRIDGGQTHLVQLCRFRHCANSTYAPAMSIVSNGVVALSHLEIDCSVVKGNPLCISLKGLAAVSNCTIRGMATSLKSEGLLAADRIDADANVQAPKDSLIIRSKFKNMALPEGTALVRGDSFADVTGVSFALSDDKTPPAEVLGQRVRTVGKQRRLDWKQGEDPESGIAGYLITAEGKEIARVPLQYDSPSDLHSPLIKPPLPTAFLDSNLANKMYDVVPINGVGLMADGKEAPTRRIGPARARFLDQGEPFVIKDFISVKGKVTLVVDEEGKKLPPTKVGISGMPNSVYFEWSEVVEAP